MRSVDRCRFVTQGDYVPALESFLLRWDAVLVEDAPLADAGTEALSAIVWQLRDGTELWRIDDTFLQTEYFVMSGESIAAPLEDLQAVLPIWTIREVRDAYDGAMAADEIARLAPLMLLMGLLGNERTDAAIVERIVPALAHRDAAVRENAALAAGLLGWEELSSALAARRAVELHPAVQVALDRFVRETPLHSDRDA